MRFLFDNNRTKKINKDEIFAEIYNLYYNKLYRLVYYLTQDENVSQDILSDFFLKVWNKLENFTQAKDIENYLFIAARNETISYLKRNNATKFQELTELITEKENVTPLECIQFKETAQTIDNVIEELPEKRKRVFKLSRYEQKTVKEIAVICKISNKTVEDHIRKSLIFLRQRLPEFCH